MIKIMVVDDNALVLRAVCETIDWAAMGCEIEGRLTNGSRDSNMRRSIIRTSSSPILKCLEWMAWRWLRP